MDRSQEAEIMWKLRNNMAAAAGIGPYSSFSSQIQQYVASNGAYPTPTYTSYTGAPLDSVYSYKFDERRQYTDKIGSCIEKLEHCTDKMGSYVDQICDGGLAHADEAGLYGESVNEDFFTMGGLREAYKYD